MTAGTKHLARAPMPYSTAAIFEAVIATAAHRFRLTPAQLAGRAQYDNIADIRAFAIYLCYALSDADHAEVGQRFAGRGKSVACKAARRGAELAAGEWHREAMAVKSRVISLLDPVTGRAHA